MSDTRLRDLERRWKKTGAVEDEAAYLLDRVRAGDLTRETLELAAYCGHDGARKICVNVPPSSSDPLHLTSEISRWGRSAYVRAALAAAELIVLPPEEGNWGPEHLDVVRQWIGCPCNKHVESIRRVIEKSIDEWDGDMTPMQRTNEHWLQLRASRAAAGDAARTVYIKTNAQAADACMSAIRLTNVVLTRQDPARGQERLLTAIRAALTSWALARTGLST